MSKLTDATGRLILSGERGGDELENICVSGFAEMIHNGTENAYVIELMKHMEENVPNLSLATSSFEIYESTILASNSVKIHQKCSTKNALLYCQNTVET